MALAVLALAVPASAAPCAPASAATASTASHLMTGIVQDQIQIAETMPQLAFYRAESNERRRSRRNPRRRGQAFGGRRGDLNHPPGQRNRFDQCAHVLV